MAYDTLTQTFEIYSEDWDLIGFKTIEVEAFFVDHPHVTSLAPNLETVIEIEHPCKRPKSITNPSQAPPKDYYYTEGGTTFTARSLVVDPPVCPVTFECLSA